MRVRSLVLALAAALALPAIAGAQAPAPAPAPAGDAFAAAVDLEPLRSIAVHAQGRVKSFESYTREMMRFVTGRRRVDGQEPAFTYLDLMLRPQRYVDRPTIYVKKKLMRAEIARTLRDSVATQLDEVARTRTDLDPAELQRVRYDLDARIVAFMESGLIAPRMLADPDVQALLSRLAADLLRTAKPVNELRTAVSVADPGVLRGELAIVPTPGGGFDDPWFTIDDVVGSEEAPAALPQLDPELRAQLAAAWTAFTTSWEASDAEGVNRAVVELATILPGINADPEVYPSSRRLAWESWYFRSRNMTWVWIPYALALAPLLLFVVFRWEGARWLGLLLFLTAFGLHTASIILRWYISGRWPNSNMFEAVTTAAWMGGVFAVPFEIFARRLPIRGMVALCSTVASMVAMMCAYYLPAQLDPHISNRMPVLHDVWLYIHTNVIIFSYCLIFMAAVTATLYLLRRGIAVMRGTSGTDDYARAGGAASLMSSGPEGATSLGRAKATLGQVLDGSTMILMELSFVLLWAGLVMGAIWADHSWGRPWGWDPKEVFALNTFVVFAILIHLRMKVRDKGFWTAIVAVIGCVVMIFNWVVINFTIAGLHSYA